MLPILYTFRRCPYAMRARMALAYAGVNYQVREVVLRDKPQAMLNISPKATVPVLQCQQDSSADSVLDESLAIMLWALDQHDPEGWRGFDDETLAQMDALVDRCEREFKPMLDRYKYADRHPERSQIEYRVAAEEFLQQLEQKLAGNHVSDHNFLFGDRLSFADVAIFPFVRQFAHVDKPWFDASMYSALLSWLAGLLEGDLFRSIMTKYPQWHEGDAVVNFAE